MIQNLRNIFLAFTYHSRLHSHACAVGNKSSPTGIPVNPFFSWIFSFFGKLFVWIIFPTHLSNRKTSFTSYA